MLNSKQFLHKTECHTLVNSELHLTKNTLTNTITKIINKEPTGSSFQNIFFCLLWKVFTTCISCPGDKETQKTKNTTKKIYQKTNQHHQKSTKTCKKKKEETTQTELYFNKIFVSKLHIHEVKYHCNWQIN